MKKEVILEGAGPYLTLWRDAFIDSLYKEMPRAIIRPNGNSIIVSHRTKVWEFYSSVKLPSDVRVHIIRRLFQSICLGCCLSFVLMMVLQVFSWQFIDLFDAYLNETTVWGILLGTLITLVCGGMLISTHNASVNLTNLGQLALGVWDQLKTQLGAKKLGSHPLAAEIPKDNQNSTSDQSSDKSLEIRYCPACGVQRETGAGFCEGCGYKF